MGTRLARGSERGGSAVEFALLGLLLVPSVIYAIYGGEAVVAGIKAQEAEISAGWSIPAYLAHDFAGGAAGAGLLGGPSSRSRDEARARLEDFDSFRDAGAGGPYGVFGYSQLTEVACGARASGSQAGPDVGPGNGLGRSRLHPDGWVGCRAEVRFENRAAVRQAHAEFFEGRPEIVQSSFERLRMCGLGSTFQGCAGSKERGFVVLTDDWALEDAAENPVGTQANRKYYAVGDEILSGSPGGVSGVLNGVFRKYVGMGEQGDTDTFKMGYLVPITKRRNSFGNDGGGLDPHLSPHCEDASAATQQTGHLGQKGHEQWRKQDHYLGLLDRAWNGQ